MRALNKGWIGIALIVLFGASLFFFRGSSRYSNLFNSDNIVASISGTPISRTVFMRSLEMNIGQFARMLGKDLSGDEIKMFQIHQLVLQDLISNAVFENEFNRIDYIIDDSVVANRTKKRFPNLYVNNKINDDALNSFLSQQRLKIEDLVDIISYETRGEVFDKLLFEKKYPAIFQEKINRYDNQSRTIKSSKIPFNDIILDNAEIDNLNKENSNIINFFDENIDNYMTSEKRDISFILIKKENLKEIFIPSENQIFDYYNNNKKLFLEPENRSFKQFNFKSKDEAEKFKTKVIGMTNSEIVNFASTNNIIFNEFESLNKNQVLDELANEIFSLNKNEISEVVETTLAHHIILLDNIIDEKQLLLDDVSNEIKNILTNVQTDNYFNELKTLVDQQILDGFSIQEIANSNDLSITNLNKITLGDDNQDDQIKAIIQASFTQNKDFISDLNDLDESTSFILNVNEIYPSIPEKIDDVFENVKSDYLRSKKISLAEKIYDQNTDNNDLDKINSYFNISSEEINVKTNENSLPTELIQKIFNADLNNVVIFSDKENVYFSKIIEIKIPSESTFLEDINLVSDLKNGFGSEVIKTKNISINDELIIGILSQYK